MIEDIDIKDPRIDEIIDLVKECKFDHVDPKNIQEFRRAVWEMVREISGAINTRDPKTLCELIDTVTEELGPHSSPDDPGSPDEHRWR